MCSYDLYGIIGSYSYEYLITQFIFYLTVIKIHVYIGTYLYISFLFYYFKILCRRVIKPYEILNPPLLVRRTFPSLILVLEKPFFELLIHHYLN